MSTRAGTFIRQPGGYQAFHPAPLPPVDLVIEPTTQALVSRADLALGRLDGVVEVISEPDLFVFMYVRREAVLSSQIEGTDASLMDVLEYEAISERVAARVDVKEILNYIRAMEHGLARLRSLPLGRRLMCEVHGVLMDGVRGGEPQKTPGRFRRSQNWIGGGSPATARFVPPPPDAVPDAFTRLEEFLHDSSPMAPLIKIGLAHAQFDAIHPFLDGNGRTGRLLITFWLMEQGLLRKPLLYPSLSFKEHRDEYVDRLQAIRDDGAWEDWLKFFLDGMAQTATDAAQRATAILSLRETDRDRIGASLGRRAANAVRLLDELFKQPVTTAKRVESALEVSQPTASNLVTALADIGILREMTGQKRYRVYAYQDYLRIFPRAESRG